MTTTARPASLDRPTEGLAVPAVRRLLLVAARFGGIRQVVSFAIVGIASTLAYAVLYAFLRSGMPAAEANAAALIVTTVGNTEANRRLTFSVRGRGSMARDQLVGFAALAVALALTSAGIVLLQAVAPHAGRTVELAVLVSANALATLVRFLLLRTLIGRGLAAAPVPAGAPGPVPVAVPAEKR